MIEILRIDALQCVVAVLHVQLQKQFDTFNQFILGDIIYVYVGGQLFSHPAQRFGLFHGLPCSAKFREARRAGFLGAVGFVRFLAP